MNLHDFGVILTILILIVFYVPLSTHYICKLYGKTYLITKKEEVHSCHFLRQRYSSLSLIASISYMIQFFDLSLWIFVYSDWYDQSKYQSILISIASSLHITTQFIITLSLTLRFWLIHFRMKFEMMSENHEWKKIINSKYINDETNKLKQNLEHSMYDIMNAMENRVNSTAFVLKYKSTLGNHRWCFWRAVIIFIVLLFMLIFAEYINYNPSLIPSNLYYIQLLIPCIIYGSFGILWSILLFLHCRSPEFNDSLYIKKELSYILQTMMFFLIIYVVFVVLFGLGLSNSNVYEEHYFNEIIILFHVLAFSNMLMLYVIVFYPLKKSKSFSRISDREMSETGDREFSVEMTKSTSKRPASPRTKPSKRIKIEDVLRNKFGFDAFMQHLSSEFSMESLLAVTEFLQFKLYIHRKYKQSVMTKDLRYWLYMLPLDALPRSEIVYFGETKHTTKRLFKVNSNSKNNTNTNMNKQKSVSTTLSKSPSILSVDSNTSIKQQQQQYIQPELDDIDSNNIDIEFKKSVKLKAYNLYFKYIRIGSEYEVNISYGLRQMYKQLLDNKQEFINNNKEYDDLTKLRDLFDKCCTIMKRLMAHSFSRFKSSKYFEKVKDQMNAS